MKLCIYCAGGYGKETLDIALRVNKLYNRWSEILFADDANNIGANYYNAKVFSFESLKSKMEPREVEFIVANGEPSIRETLFDKIHDNKYSLTTLIDPSAIISSSSTIKPGAIIGPGTTISSDTMIDKNVAIMIGAVVGHDIKIGEHAVVSSHASIGGGSLIEEKTYLGMGSVVKENLTIGTGSIVGMGAVVFNNIDSNIIALGNPARPIRRNTKQTVFK